MFLGNGVILGVQSWFLGKLFIWYDFMWYELVRFWDEFVLLKYLGCLFLLFKRFK